MRACQTVAAALGLLFLILGTLAVAGRETLLGIGFVVVAIGWGFAALVMAALHRAGRTGG